MTVTSLDAVFEYLQLSVIVILLQAVENEGEDADEYLFEGSAPASTKAETSQSM